MFESPFSKNSKKLEARRQRVRSITPSPGEKSREPKIDPVKRAEANSFLKREAERIGYPNASVWDSIFLMEKHYAIRLPEIEKGEARSKTAIAMAEAVRSKLA